MFKGFSPFPPLWGSLTNCMALFCPKRGVLSIDFSRKNKSFLQGTGIIGEKISKIFWRKINSFLASELFDRPCMKILYECLKIIISEIVVFKNLFFIDKNLSIFEKNIINFKIWGASVRKYWGFWVYGICGGLVYFN